MSASFFTGSEIELYNGAKGFAARIVLTPAAYGLTQPTADGYDEATTTYTLAYDACRDPQTRTKLLVAAKNAARDELRRQSSLLAKIVEGTASVTDVQKLELGLNIRKTPAPIPAPTERPAVDVVSVNGRTVTTRIHDTASSTKRGKPAGALAALVYTFVGETYPTDLSAWRLEGSATKAEYAITFSGQVPGGQQVWIRAAWVNRKQESGPLSEPVTTNVQGGGSVQQSQDLKIAA